MQPCRIPMPGALRLRSLQPLIDGDGACSLVYDVERAAVFEVPADLQLYVAPALETGDLDEELLGWLASEDLLTGQGWGDWSGCGAGRRLGAGLDRRGRAGEVLRQAGGRGLAGLTHGGEEIHGWIDQTPAAAAIESVDMVFRRGRAGSRLKLHLDWVGTFPPDGLLEKVVFEARRRAELSGQEVVFELALEPDQVTDEVARRLAAQPVRVRLRCGESDSLGQLGTPQENRPWLLAEPAVRILLEPLARSPAPLASSLMSLPQLPAMTALAPDPAAPPPAEWLPPVPLTLQCVLDGPARLIELWRWAKAVGVRSLDAIRLEQPATGAAGGATPAARLRDYRQDMQAIYEEMCGDLEAGRQPVEFQPLTRLARRLMRSEPPAVPAAMTAWCDERVMQVGGARFPGLESLDPRQLPELAWRRLERSSLDSPEALEVAEAEAGRLPCQACWARQVCGHSAYVASPLAGEDPREPSRERCAFWLAEVEMAVRLYHRLTQIDAIQVLRFLDGEAGLRLPSDCASPQPLCSLSSLLSLQSLRSQPFSGPDSLEVKPS